MAGKFNVTHADGRELECPCFVLLAKDVFAMAGIRAYLDAVQRDHPDLDFSDEIVMICSDFWEWRAQYPSKVRIPD